MLFDALAKYVPVSPDEAVSLIDRLTSFLRHSNPAVVIGSFKCIFLFLDHDSRPKQEVLLSILPPFLTLVSSGNTEIQYIVLRTLNLFSQRYPKALAKEIRIFFCKYNDPSYIKTEKLGIITANVSPNNARLILDELAEYCNSVDVDFVRKAVMSIGEIALKLESCAPRSVDILVNLVEGKAGYAVEQSVLVLSDILRKFPGHFESIIAKVCRSIDQIKDPQARAAAIWILGEYGDLIEKVDVILDPFLDTFVDESPLVQLQILSSLVKIYLSKPDDTREQLQFVLNKATDETMQPDIRNRALIYWRMLSLSVEEAKQFVQFVIFL
jgi:vesicle coat complex subunit